MRTRSYSCDMRERVIEAVEAGASRREAAEIFGISVASAVKWVQRWRKEGSARAKPRGGSSSPLEKFADKILAVSAEQPDLTLDEMVAVLRKQGTRVSRSALFRFFERHDITFKKKPASNRTTTARRGESTAALDPRARRA
jgi:transposase